MTKKDSTRRVDQTALRVNQSFIIGLLVLAFVLDSRLLVAFVGGVMLLGTAVPALALFKQIYLRLLKPTGWLKANIIEDNPEPHQFAQGFGGTVVTTGAIALWFGQVTVGWALSWMVIVLAALNLFAGFCAGCFVYYQLSRLGVSGFSRKPIR
jgi:hypothetical protein